MKENMSKTNRSVARAFQIIEIMANHHEPIRLQELAATLDLSASTVLRFLMTLIDCGYVSKDPDTLKYSLTMKFCQIGHLISSRMNITKVVRPYLVELSKTCEEAACLAVEQHLKAVYIDAVEGPNSILRTLQRIGVSAPLHSTGVGKSLLLNFSDSAIDRLFEDGNLLALTENTITSKVCLVEELDRVRTRGYALDNEECEKGVRCVAAPLKDYTGNIVAAVSISGPVSRLVPERLEFIKTQVLKTARQVSQILGYEGP